ncbi:MAG: zinc metallopeptidase [Coriobacteriales bacterium]|jgi:Zn-dependent membrane protease YugP|nr:zinc metallopeptidase [Coriobacteriales bacterium]
MQISYLALIIIVMVLGFGAQALIRATYNKWNKVKLSAGPSGAEAARKMLDAHGLSQVSVTQVEGTLSDHFDPRTNVVSLSSEVYQSRSVAAVAVACHECGHAVQTAHQYMPARIRSAIVPVVSVASNLWVIVLLAGIFLSMLNLIYIAIAMFAAVLVFQIVTLPVEFDASRRALAFIRTSGWLAPSENTGAARVLRAAALTYVAAALASLLQLLYFIGAFGRR